jgi:type VI secretion system activator RovC-like protein/transcriptional regulator
VARPRVSAIPDWTDEAAYAPLLQLERSGFAWEWLRRRKEYETAARQALDRRQIAERLEDKSALAWNLHAFESPDLSAPEARPVWTAAAHPWVVRATAERFHADRDALNLERLGPFATLVRSRQAQRLLLSDGYRSIRLDLRGSEIGSSPVRLTYELNGIEALERPLLVLRRLRALSIRCRFRGSLHPRFSRARRLVQLLRTHDALRAGASQADIALVLLRPELERSRWRIHSPSIRSQAQRLVGAARQMSGGAFWHLLE